MKLSILILILTVYAVVFLNIKNSYGSDLCSTIRNYVNTYGIELVRQGAKAKGYSDKVIRDLERKCKLNGGRSS